MGGDSARIDTSVAHPARRYDYILGGKDNFEADRVSGDEILARMPTARLTAWENRYFLHRAVRYLAGQGVRQFLDIGTGIPTSPNTHEIAQEREPTSRVIYVDNDPLVLAHARALLTGDKRGRTAYIEADLRSPKQILADPQLRDVLDLTQPVALMLIAVLHFVRDEENPRAALGELIGALAPGSYVVATHGTSEHLPAEVIEALREVVESQTADRDRAGLAALFDFPGLELIEPVRSVSLWWPEDAPEPRPRIEDVACNALIARVL